MDAAKAAVYGPDGTVYMVPNTDIPDALKNGGQLAVPMKSPKGDSVWVHTSDVKAAQDAGGKVDWSSVPEGVHAGFWQTFKNDLMANVRTVPGESIQQMVAGSVTGEKGQRLVAQDTARDIAAGNMSGMYGHLAASEAPAVVGAIGGVVAPKVGPLVRASAQKIAASAPVVKSAAAAAADVGAAVLNNDVAGAFSPRAKHIGSILGKLADALRKGESVKPGEIDFGPIPEEGSLPVTTPSDVPLEQMPSEEAAPASNLKESPLMQQSKQKIRANAEAARSKKTFADVRDDQTLQDAANADLAQHGRNAYAEQRREFQANNSMDVPKWQRIAESKAADILEQAQQQVSQILADAEKKATTPVKYTKTPPLSAQPASQSGDLTSLLEQSIAAAKAKKSAK